MRNNKYAPAIAGTYASWIEVDGLTQRIRTAAIGSAQPSAIVASISTTNGLSLGRPVMSSEYIVWDQLTNASSSYSQIMAYNRSTGASTTVGTFVGLSTNYAVADHRIVWNDQRLHLYDLSNQTDSILYTGQTYSPAINGNTVVWSMRSASYTVDTDIWGINLPNGQPTPLIVAAGNQAVPAIVPGGPNGSIVAWQNEGYPSTSTTLDTANDGHISTAVLSVLFASPPALPTQSTATPTSLSPTSAPPLVKGIHAANGDGWDLPQVTDALGADRGRPYFGAVEVLLSDLTKNTGRSAPWGPHVSNAMQAQASAGVRVLVRTDPTLKLSNTQPYISTEDLLQQVRQTVIDYPGVHDVQINNEPNLEWTNPCPSNNPCHYTEGGYTMAPLSWGSLVDHQFYDAIEAYYLDGFGTLHFYQVGCDPSTDPQCTAIRGLRFWTPPMSECYCHLDNGHLPYEQLQGLIYTYQEFGGGFSYHVYPAPNTAGNFGGTLFNLAFLRFTSRMMTDVDRPSGDQARLPSQISEWGWDPNVMRECDNNDPNSPYYCGNESRNVGCSSPSLEFNQNMTWAASPQGVPLPVPILCLADDHADHTFSGDAIGFLNAPQELHHADSVYVWLVKRGHGFDYNTRADGIDDSGTILNWLSTFRDYLAP